MYVLPKLRTPFNHDKEKAGTAGSIGRGYRERKIGEGKVLQIGGESVEPLSVRIDLATKVDVKRSGIPRENCSGELTCASPVPM